MREIHLKKFFIFLLIILSTPIFTASAAAQSASQREIYLKQLQQKEAIEKQKNKIIAQENIFKNFLYGDYAAEIGWYDDTAGENKKGLAILKIKPYSSNAISVDIILDLFKVTDIIMPITLYSTDYSEYYGGLRTRFRAEHIKKEIQKNITEYNNPAINGKFTKVNEKEIIISNFVITSELLTRSDGSGFFDVSLEKMYTPELNKLSDFIYAALLNGYFNKLNEDSTGYFSLFDTSGRYMTFKNIEMYLEQLSKKGNSHALSLQRLTSLNLSSIPEPKIEFKKELDFRPYINELYSKIKGNWNCPPISTGTPTKSVTILLKINKNGNLLALNILNSSGVPEIDYAIMNAVKMSVPFKPLPAEYKGVNMDIQFTFYDSFALLNPLQVQHVKCKGDGLDINFIFDGIGLTPQGK